MSAKLPLVIILGATGSGKTKLSLKLAEKFSGEIISADSMQVYKGLDIITAKVKKDEQLLVPHHLIDILEPNECFTVLEYRNRAVGIIDKLISQKKLPILVGGTNYYIESILWNYLIEDVGQGIILEPWVSSNNDHKSSSQELYSKLQLLDPDMARRLHPNNKRKIMRSLEIFYQKGRRHSEILKEQHSTQGGSKTSGALRYPNSLILWLNCEKKVLISRLNERVDKMVEEGLIDELLYFHQHFKDRDYTKGVFQSIGFKEFHSYLRIEENEKGDEVAIKTLHECIELLKIATRQYANKQIRWIKNRFLSRSDREVPPIYGLDTTILSQWQNNVFDPASKIVESYILGTTCPYEKLQRISTNSNPNSEDDTYICNVCDRVFVGIFQWNCHLRSIKHKKMLVKKRESAT